MQRKMFLKQCKCEIKNHHNKVQESFLKKRKYSHFVKENPSFGQGLFSLAQTFQSNHSDQQVKRIQTLAKH